MGALHDVRDALESGLARGGEALLGYARTWQGDAAEKEVVRAVGAAYVRVLVPFLRRAVVEGVFGVAFESDAPCNGEGDGSLRDMVKNWESWLLETSS